jgi:hypothetical protein
VLVDFQMSRRLPNQAASVNAPATLWFHAWHAWQRVTELRRSTTQKPTRPARNITAFLGQDEQDLQDGSDLGEPQDQSCPSCYPVQTPGSFSSSGAVYHEWLAGSFPPEVPMRSVELDGPANGCQPARRVAMRTSPVAGSRR